MTDGPDMAPAAVDARANIPSRLRCDAVGCTEEIMMRHGGEQYCYAHCLARANAERAARGFPPILFDDGAMPHVCH